MSESGTTVLEQPDVDTQQMDVIFAGVEKLYPGLTNEVHEYDVIQFNGAINPLTVQVRTPSMQSPSLVDAMSKGGYAEHMLSTPGMQINTIGNDAFIASLPPGGVSIAGGYKCDYVITHQEDVKYWFDGEHGMNAADYNTMRGLNTSGSITLFVKSLDPRVKIVTSSIVGDFDVMANGVSATEAYNALVMKIFAHYGITPLLGFAFKRDGGCGLNGTITTGDFKTYPDTNGEWDALLKKYSLIRVLTSDIVATSVGRNDIRCFPCVPGYSRVFIEGAMDGTGKKWCLMTYIKGDAWVDYYYGSHPSFAKGTHRRPRFKARLCSPAFPSGKDANQFPVPKHPPTGFTYLRFEDLTETQIREYARRSGNTFSANYVGCTLFGAPYVDLAVIGKVTSKIVKSSMLAEGSVINFHSIEADQFRWVIPKTWYSEYYKTGFGVFTPRASNIQKNVLDEWDKLEYDELIIRGLASPYQFKMSVSTLPEARIYAKARAKACKDNNWMEQSASANGKYTWGKVDSLSKAYGPRDVFISTQNSLTNNSIAITRKGDPVVYSMVDGKVTRVQSGVTTTLDPQNEDHRGIILEDKYFGNVSLSGTTWEAIIIEDDLEKESLTDTKDFDVTDSSLRLGDPQKAKLIGFGPWIDPFPKGDITDLNDEQLFRLHIVNLTSLDRMTRPLVKIINSFGYDTIIKFAKTIK